MSPSDRTLRKIYDQAFDERSDDEYSRPGMAHSAGLRAVYERGRLDGEKAERKRQKNSGS